ncbi:hypothetical protein BC936DRAFT_149244 [Jimgerdemannia flammicorona]|uniref:Uncharacterized protein n=1 Tax=Jimgerdemannia flammicorona TaxID=994334 RepID=A0A433D179_9FUNG|nr:hypothetical protein BC936DRAFT_149244 [Jimgerdemannia flammicorona]
MADNEHVSDSGPCSSSDNQDEEYVFAVSSSDSDSTFSGDEVSTAEILQMLFDQVAFSGAKTMLKSGTVVEEKMVKLIKEYESESYVHSWILFLDDAKEMNKIFSKDDLRYLRSLWRKQSVSCKYFTEGYVDERVRIDIESCTQFLKDVENQIKAGLSARNLWDSLTSIPVRRTGETRETHRRTVIVRRVVVEFLERCMEQSDEHSEAELMKSVWDLLFDKLSKLNFIVSATEDTVSASKARRMHTVTGARGKMAEDA